MLVPLCTEMCPRAERRFRQQNALLHPLEKDNHVEMVKEYTRSAAGVQHGDPKVLRTPGALTVTVDYLLAVYGREDIPFGLRFSFVEDRLRSVRQDATISRLDWEHPIVAAELLEKQLSFLLRSEFCARLARSNALEPKLHETAIEECSQRWQDITELVRLPSNELRAQVAAALCLRRASDSTSLITVISMREVLGKPLADTVFQLCLAVREGNFAKLFRLLSAQPRDSLLTLALLRSIATLRKQALTTIARAYRSPPVRIPAETMQRWLGFPDEKAILECLATVGMIPEDGAFVPAKIDQNNVSDCDIVDAKWIVV